MRCEEAMTEEVETVAITDTVLQAARRMRELDIGFLPVVQEDGTPVGTITDRDIVVRALAAERPPTTRVDEVMSPDVVCCRPDDEVEEAERLMRANQVSRVLVVDETGQVAGVISLADVARADTEPEAGETLSDVKTGAPGSH
jgi:CBS domain-containing protein